MGVYSSCGRLLNEKDLFKDIIESPDRDDVYYENYIESKYCSVKQTGQHFEKANKQKRFSMLHCNMRSLTKNLSLLQDILLSVKETPSVITNSETKLNDKSCLNINTPNYTYL